MNTQVTLPPIPRRLLPPRNPFAPNLRQRILLATSTVVLALTLGCASEPAESRAIESTKYTLANTDKFVLLDEPSQQAIACTGLQERALADGRLEIVANLKNRDAKPIAVQASCVFKDNQGLATGIESPWQTVQLSENATEAVRFTAVSAAAKKYTIQVRQPL